MKYQIFKQKFSEMEGLNLRIREAKQGFLFFCLLYITDSPTVWTLHHRFFDTRVDGFRRMVILHNLLHQSCSHVCADTLSSQPHLYVLQMYQDG